MTFANPKRNIEQFGLEPGMEVADFGAGAGYLAVEAAEAVGKDGTVYVVEIQQDLLTKATHLAKEHHNESLVFIHADVEKPKGSTLGEASVDAVVLSNVLFQAHKKDDVLKEAYRILRPKGRILVVDWKESYGGMGPQPEQVLSEEGAKKLVSSNGFMELSSIDAGAYHYGIIFKKT